MPPPRPIAVGGSRQLVSHTGWPSREPVIPLGTPQARYAQQNAFRRRGIGVCHLPGVTATGSSQRSEGGIGVEVVRRRVSDGRISDVSRAWTLGRVIAGCHVYQPVVAGPTTHAIGGRVLSPLPQSKHDFNLLPLEGAVLLPGNISHQLCEPFVAFLNDLAGYLIWHLSSRGPRTFRVLEGVGSGEPGLADYLPENQR